MVVTIALPIADLNISLADFGYRYLHPAFAQAKAILADDPNEPISINIEFENYASDK